MRGVDVSEQLTIKRPIEELYKAFHLLNKRIFAGKLPTPAIVIQNQGNRTRNILGWCTSEKIWANAEKNIRKYEITITAEYLNREVAEVIHTLIHEMVHLFCIENDIKDTSRSGYYHNKKFKQQAEIAGLNVEFDKSRGWAQTSLRPETRDLIDSLNLDSEAFILKRYTWEEVEGEEGEEKEPKKRKVKPIWTCPKCEDPKIKTDKELNIICGKCMKRFIKIDPEEDEECDESED